VAIAPPRYAAKSKVPKIPVLGIINRNILIISTIPKMIYVLAFNPNPSAIFKASALAVNLLIALPINTNDTKPVSTQ